jgi:hypothetical protein
MPRRTLTNSLDKDDLSEDGIPTLPILTRAQHRRLINKQRTIIRTLSQDFSPERNIYYILFDMPQIFHKDALEDILEVQLMIYEIIFDQRNRTVYVFYSRNLLEGTFTRLRGERDNMPGCPPQYDSDGNEIHTDKESNAT